MFRYIVASVILFLATQTHAQQAQQETTAAEPRFGFQLVNDPNDANNQLICVDQDVITFIIFLFILVVVILPIFGITLFGASQGGSGYDKYDKQPFDYNEYYNQYSGHNQRSFNILEFLDKAAEKFGVSD